MVVAERLTLSQVASIRPDPRSHGTVATGAVARTEDLASSAQRGVIMMSATMVAWATASTAHGLDACDPTQGPLPPAHDDGIACCGESDVVHRGDIAQPPQQLDITDVSTLAGVIDGVEPYVSIYPPELHWLSFAHLDVSEDGSLDQADVDHLLGYLFLGTHPEPRLLRSYETCSCIGDPESCAEACGG